MCDVNGNVIAGFAAKSLSVRKAGRSVESPRLGTRLGHQIVDLEIHKDQLSKVASYHVSHLPQGG